MPDVEYENGLLTIMDNFGGTVKFTLDELEFVIAKTHNLIEHIREDMQRKNEDLKQQLIEKAKVAEKATT
jgi:hypothetical protein